MKEIPILFSTEMVKAILAGRKTQTRRIVKANGKATAFRIAVMPDGTKIPFGIDEDEAMQDYIKCPYGKPGDRLWVRETWQHMEDHWFDASRFFYKADYPYYFDDVTISASDIRWKPSIFMPREACRIILEVTDVRVEMLQDISEEDAIAEGVGSGFQMNGGWPDYEHIKNGVCAVTQDTARMSYWSLWDKINGKGSWDKNPWVWVVSFKRIEL